MTSGDPHALPTWRHPQQYQSSLPGKWFCWVHYIEAFRTAEFPKRNVWALRNTLGDLTLPLISDTACASTETFEKFVQQTFTAEDILTKENISHQNCCFGRASAPSRCIGSSLESTSEMLCPSLDDVGGWFSLQVLQGQGADKGRRYHDYYREYEAIMSKFPSNARVLEVGIAQGNSLATWGAWFPHGFVMGIDTDLTNILRNWPLLTSFGANSSGNVRFRHCYGQKPQFALRKQNFNIIIEDADHEPSNQIQIFESLFPQILALGGVYIVEDIAEGQAADYFRDLSKFATHRKGSSPSLVFMEGVNDFYERRFSLDWRDYIAEIRFLPGLVVVGKLRQFFK